MSNAATSKAIILDRFKQADRAIGILCHIAQPMLAGCTSSAKQQQKDGCFDHEKQMKRDVLYDDTLALARSYMMYVTG